MTRRMSVFVFVLCAIVLIACMGEVTMALQRGGPPGQAGRGGPPGAAPAAAQGGQRGAPASPASGSAGITTAPLGWLIGTTGEVSKPTPWADPLAPATDTYYLDLPQGEEPPDEFLSNPDHEFDWRDLKSWNYPAVIRSFQILGNRRVAPGQTVQFECIVQDFSGTQNGCSIGYYSPLGRVQTMNGRLSPVVEGGNIMRGSLTIPRHATPGTWRAVQLGAGNETRSGKVYWADTHPAGKNLDIEVLSVNNDRDVDITAPVVEWVKMTMLDQPEGTIRSQPITDSIPIFARMTDDKSGVAGARVKIQGPQSACLA
ncbi:MAG: hypothetical protein HY646_01890, partial [Acidobacteria bacterium]|nr:hypothetical protein [Acidobacteriota bacterium]